MKKRDRISSITLLFLSLLFCYGAVRYSIGSFNNPGPGFFPLLLAIVTGSLSLVILAKTAMEKRIDQSISSISPEPFRSKKVVSIVLALTAYGLLLERLGYTPTTFLLFIFLLRGITPQKWFVVLIGSLVASVGSYALFQVLLKAQLPIGPLGM